MGTRLLRLGMQNMQLFAACTENVSNLLWVLFTTHSPTTHHTLTHVYHTHTPTRLLHTTHWCTPQNHTTEPHHRWLDLGSCGPRPPPAWWFTQAKDGGGWWTNDSCYYTGIPEVTRMLLFIVTQTSRGKTQPVYLYTPIDRFEVLYVEDTVSKCRSIGNPLIWDLENHPL